MNFGVLFAFAEQVTAENTKRILYTVFLLLIVVLALISLIGSIIVKITKYQGSLLDREMSDPIRNNVIKTEKHFMKYAVKKNNLIFVKQSAIPLLIVFVGVFILVIRNNIAEDWSYNPWSMENGFGSLLITWDFSTIIKVNPDGVAGMLVNWPEVTHYPSFDIHYWCGYLCCTCYLVGGLWYLYCVQGLIGRTFRIIHLKHKIYNKSLEDFNLADSQASQANEQPK